MTARRFGASRRTFVQLLGAGGATMALGACDIKALVRDLQAADGNFAPPDAADIDLATHALNRLTWGATPGEYERVLGLGFDAFLEEQLDPESIHDSPATWKVASIESLAEPPGELYEYHPRQLLLDLSRGKLLRGIYSARQLYEIMVDFWTDHLNIVSEKGHCKWLKAADDRTVVRAHALGRFRDLIRASAVSPAMLIYLDGHDNKVVAPGDRPNENYARELLELHTLGVHGGYTQADVAEVARALSGWTYRHAPLRFKPAHVAFDPSRHDNSAKIVLGHRIPAGGGADDLDRVLDIVCRHPATARHLAGKLCRRFIADPAPDEAVDAVTKAFLDTDGDIKSVLRAVFQTNAFRTNRGTLFKRPLRFVIGALRATDANSNCSPAIVEYLERMGHAPFQYPSPDGYPLEEPPWLGTMLWRWKFAQLLATNGVSGTSIDLASLQERAGGPARLAAHILGRTASPQETAALAATDQTLALLLSSPAFQRH